MNERIQELAYQAEEYADIIVDQGGEFHITYTKKLAELIVKECIDIVLDSSVEYTTRPQIAEELKEHFGVD